MTKIKNTGVYIKETEPTLSDFLVGTKDSNGKTKSFSLEAILQLLNSSNGVNNIQFKFSNGLHPTIDFLSAGYFFTDTNTTEVGTFTELIFNKETIQPLDLSPLFNKLGELENVVIKLENPEDPNNFFNFKVVSFADNTDYFTFGVEDFNELYLGEFENGKIYSFYFDIQSTEVDLSNYDTKTEVDAKDTFVLNSANSYTDAKTSGVYIYKGNKTNYADLVATGEHVNGYVYNLSDTDKNYAWNGSTWDDIGGTFDISGKADLVEGKVPVYQLPSSKDFSIFDDNFEDGTSSLTLSAGWSVGSDGIAISTSGGWTNSALYNINSILDRVSTRALVQIIDVNSIFAVIRKPNVLNLYGVAAQINCSTSTINLYTYWDGSGTPPPISKTITIPFSIVANRKYLIDLKKDKGLTTVIFTDETNINNTVTLSFLQPDEVGNALGVGIGRQWGSPGVMFNSGSIKLKRLTYYTVFPSSPKLMITGHSFVDGLGLYLEGDVTKSYSNLLYNELYGDLAISGRGGSIVSEQNLVDDIKFFRPKYLLTDIGSNDTVYATFISGLETYIRKIESIGAIPILCTITPRSDRQTFINLANDWIRLSGYNYVDFAKAVTLSNDGVTQNPAFFYDGVHPNAVGNAEMLKQIKVDCPYIFDGISDDNDFIGEKITTTVSINSSRLTDNCRSQKGKVVLIDNGSNNINYTIKGGSMSFIKRGTGVITFVQGTDRTLVQANGTVIFNGALNSTASIVSYETTDILYINNL